MRDQAREFTRADFARSIPRKLRERLTRGQIAEGEDIAVLRRFVGLTQEQFATTLGISVHTLRNWEQGRRTPEGPALALLRIAARHPRVHMLFAYTKTAQEDLTADQVRVLARIVREEFK